jgi:hypothetical protein
VTSMPRSTEFYRHAVLSRIPVDHLTVEVRRCGCNGDGGAGSTQASASLDQG